MLALFARPEAATRMTLAAEPVLESWNATSHPDQQRLRAYVEAFAAQVGLNDWPAQEPRVVELTVGLPQELAVDRSGRDLDNYLYPLVRHLGASRIAAAFARKLHQHGFADSVQRVNTPKLGLPVETRDRRPRTSARHARPGTSVPTRRRPNC